MQASTATADRISKLAPTLYIWFGSRIMAVTQSVSFYAFEVLQTRVMNLFQRSSSVVVVAGLAVKVLASGSRPLVSF